MFNPLAIYINYHNSVDRQNSTIIRITSNCRTYEHKYYVDFEKQSIGSNIGLVLQQIRPQSSRLISYEDIREGEAVLVNFNNDSAQERGYWYESYVEKKLLTKRKLFASIHLADIVLKGQKIQFIHEMYKIETNVKITERSIEDELLIQFGAKPKRK